MIFIFMVFAHIFASIYLSGAINREWWKSEYSPARKSDNVVALAIHSAFWAFTMLLPIAYKLEFDFSWFYTIAFITNAIIYAIIIYAKSINNRINLFLQQLAHLWQITLTYLLFVLCNLLA